MMALRRIISKTHAAVPVALLFALAGCTSFGP